MGPTINLGPHGCPASTLLAECLPRLLSSHSEECESSSCGTEEKGERLGGHRDSPSLWPLLSRCCGGWRERIEKRGHYGYTSVKCVSSWQWQGKETKVSLYHICTLPRRGQADAHLLSRKDGPVSVSKVSQVFCIAGIVWEALLQQHPA